MFINNLERQTIKFTLYVTKLIVDIEEINTKKGSDANRNVNVGHQIALNMKLEKAM